MQSWDYLRTGEVRPIMCSWLYDSWGLWDRLFSFPKCRSFDLPLSISLCQLFRNIIDGDMMLFLFLMGIMANKIPMLIAPTTLIPHLTRLLFEDNNRWLFLLFWLMFLSRCLPLHLFIETKSMFKFFQIKFLMLIIKLIELKCFRYFLFFFVESLDLLTTARLTIWTIFLFYH